MTQEQTQLQIFIAQYLPLADMAEDEQKEVLKKVEDVLSKRVFVDLFPELSDEDRFVLRDMLSDGELSNEEIDQFLRSVIGKHKEIVRESVRNFFEEMHTFLQKDNI